jgi:broad specificity phosphatase PhoE
MPQERGRTIIHLVRHGEVLNPDNIRYGRLPGWHLSDEGRKQVEQTSLFFVKRPIVHIYSSPLERTQQTATILALAFPHVPITLDDRISEVKTGAEYEGKPRTDAFIYPKESQPDFESEPDIAHRLQGFIEEKIAQHSGQEIIAVTHGDPIALMTHFYLYNKLSVTGGMYPYFASVFSLCFEGHDMKTIWYHGGEA